MINLLDNFPKNITNMSENNALILTNGLLDTENGKTAHGLIRATDRYNIVGVIDPAELRALGGKAGIPNINIGPLQQATPKNKNKDKEKDEE